MLGLLLALACAPKAPTTTAPTPTPPPEDPLATQPTVAGDIQFSPPVAVERLLSNGVKLWTVESRALPIVSVSIRVPGGSVLDPAGKEGAASLGARLLTQGAGGRDAEAFAAEVERLGIDLASEVGADDAVIRFGCTREVLPQALALVADMILRPAFSKVDFARERELAVASIQEGLDEPGYVAQRTAAALYWGAAHPYGRPTDGTIAGLGKLRLEDVKAWHKSAWVAAGAGIVVSGAISADEAAAAVEPVLGKAWAAGRRVAPSIAPAPAHPDAPIYVVDKPDSAQTGFYLVFPGVKAGDAALPTLQTGTIVLGGTFTSRLNALLREKKGYTYGVRAAVAPQRQGGVLLIRSRIRTDVTAPALVDLFGELDGIRAGIREEERAKAFGAWRQDVVEAMSTRGGAVATFADLLATGEAPDALQTRLAAMKAVGTAAVTPAMAAWDPKQGVVVLVGDRAKIEPELAKVVTKKIQVVEPVR